MAIVSSVLTQAQIDQLVSLRDQLGSNNTTLGAGRAAYDLLFQWISAPDGSGPVAGVDHNVWVWLKGARLVNSGEGPFADLIRNYTAIQYKLRTGHDLEADKPGELTKASNNIAFGFLNEWIAGANQIPDILKTGNKDAGPVAAEIFDGNIAGWAGTFLFTNLGDPHHYQDQAINKLSDPYTLSAGAQDLGSYDIVAIAQGVQDYTSFSLSVAYQTLANLFAVFQAPGDLARYQPTIDAAKVAADAAFKIAYGLTDSADPQITIGSDTLGGSNVATNIGKSAHYAVGTDQNDVIGRAISPNGSYIAVYDILPGLGLPTNNVVNAGRGNDTVFGVVSAGSNVLDGNEGFDTLSYAMGGAWTTTTLKVRFDGKGNFHHRTIVDKDYTFSSDARDVAVNFEELVFDYRYTQDGFGEHLSNSGAAVVTVTWDGDGVKQGNDLIRSERVEVTGSLKNMYLSGNLQIDGGGETAAAVLSPGLGDVLDFSSRTDGIAVKDANDGSNAVELFDKASSSASGIRFTDFEHVVGSAYNDTLNLNKLSPGGAPTTAEQTQIDAANAAFRATVGTGLFVSKPVYDAAVSTLIASLGAIRPYQQHLLVEGNGGNDIIKGSDVGITDVFGGDGTDFLFGGAYGSILNGGAGTDWLIADGLESQLTGGDGNDLFTLANKAFVMDATAGEDYATWGGFRLTGGVQQWWMEAGWAYFAPATSVISAALGPFGGLLNVTGASAVVLDIIASITMFRYTVSDGGQLVIQAARGYGGQAVIQNYTSSGDTGASSANITVFKQQIVEGKATLEAGLGTHFSMAA
jgi:RTX calcium-binding nonapeptide repeat (4 copies)